jgi:hypothetical protein
VDGVLVGSGVWQGRLESGRHRVEIAAEGHVSFRGEASIEKGKTERLAITLERDLDDPMWGARFRPHVYAEAVGGMLLAPSLGGGADEKCGGSVALPDGTNAPGCSKSPLALGFLAGARGGYQLTKGFGVEIFLGYASITEHRTRAIVASVEGTPYGSRNYEDTMKMSGPLAALSAAYAPLEWLVGRLSAGVIRANLQGENQGTYVGSETHPDDPNVVASVTQKMGIPEVSQNVWAPFLAPAIEGRYRLTDLVSLEFGVTALFVLSPPDTPRTGLSPFGGSAGEPSAEGDRVGITTPVPGGFGVDVDNDGAPDDVPGDRPLSLPREDAIGTFFAIAPTLGVRLDF